ncbi:MAG: hypothetical protein V5804_04830 [Mucilaginibacter sp.]|uniref:hypothetical protein n=1 Tax=Mucilaginibacter sp. TaxID=1882438 RepID=UPI0034E3EF91
MNKTASANDTRHYIILAISIFIGIFGVYFRFFGDTVFYTIVANIFFIGAIVLCLRTVFAILK